MTFIHVAIAGRCSMVQRNAARVPPNSVAVKRMNFERDGEFSAFALSGGELCIGLSRCTARLATSKTPATPAYFPKSRSSTPFAPFLAVSTAVSSA